MFRQLLVVLWFSGLACASGTAQTGLKRPLIVVPAKTVAAGDAGRCSDPTQPCFQNNKDILGGQHTLQSVQDIFVSLAVSPDGNTPYPATATCLTTNSACASTSETHSSAPYQPLALATQQVRFDQSGKLTALTATLTDGNLMLVASTSKASTPPTSFGFVNNPSKIYGQYILYSAAADLNADGLDEAAFAGLEQVVVVDHNLHHGTVFRIGHDVVGVAAGPVAGKPQIAVLWTLATELHVSTFTVDSNLNLVPGPSAKVSAGPGGNSALFSASMTSGYFTRLDSLQLVAQYTDMNQNSSVVSVDFDGQGNPYGKSVTLVSGERYYAKLVSGHFLSTPYDQVVSMLYDQVSQGYGLTYYQFNINDFSLNSDHPYASYSTGCIYDIAVGSFDTQTPASGSQPATLSPLDQVVVAKSSSCGASGFQTSIYKVSATPNDNFSVASTQSYPAPNTPAGSGTFISGLSIAAVDLQGRSLFLGVPTIVTLSNHAQPSVIVGAPPMHVDYLVTGTGKPMVVNFSAAPDGFSSQFQSSNSNGTGQETQSSNTWSFSSTETTNNSVSIGDCDLGDCASASAKFSAKQAVDGTKSKTGTSYGTDSESLQSQTGFGDEIIQRQSTVTTYVYPVIGRFVCPSSIPNCTAAQQVQENVQIAGQDSITTIALNGTDVPWYQPVWMPGNILSYPGTETLLEQDQNLGSSFQELGNTISGFKTDGSGNTQVDINWAQTNGTTKSSGLTQNYSFDASLSVTLKASLEVVDVSTEDSLDLAGSYGLSNLLTSSTSLSASRGVQINRTAHFSDASAYAYELTPYIYGQTQPAGVVDSAGLNTDIQTFGALRLGFTAQPLAGDGSSGYVWRDWYGRTIDIGLNQPAKWQIVQDTSSPSTDAACLVPSNSTSVEDCAQLGNDSPNEPDADEFRYLRGLFLQAVDANGANGPQLEEANDSNTIQLGLRVYNFSIVALPPGATVHARFFAMPSADSQPPASGDSIFLGEETTSSLAAFSSSNTPNWTLIPHTLNLAKYPQFSGQFLYFWVFVWAEDASGKLIPDLPYHGIQSLPPAAAPGSAAEYKNYASLEEAYGNNMGLYHAPLYVNNPTQVGNANAPTSVEIIRSGARHSRVRQGRPDKISVVLKTGSGAITNGLTVLFYDGDPANEAKAFAYKLIPYLKADSEICMQANFRSGTLGEHRIYVVAGPGTNLMHEVIADTVDVVAHSKSEGTTEQ